MKIKWLGQSGFKIGDLLIDPWMEKMIIMPMDPPYKFTEQDKEVNLIVITHDHEDHMNGSVKLAKEKQIPLVGCVGSLGKFMEEGLLIDFVDIGGPITVGDWEISMVDAKHSGDARGVILKKDDITIYHAGDTGLFSDMKMIAELYQPNIALLPIGGRFTMDAKQAAIAAEWLKVKKVIPMHYNTFPLIQADPEKFKTMVKSAEVVVLKIGEEKEF